MRSFAVCALVSGGCIVLPTDVPLDRCDRGPPLDAAPAVARPEVEDCLAGVDALLAASPADAFVAVQGEQLVYAWGDVHLPSNTASVRKSVVSVLFGVAADRGLVDLDATLESLGVDDAASPLTAEERTATVRDLLQSRSGIYIEPLGEPESWAERRPARGTHAPGEAWFYNNWDFNALGTVFVQATGWSLEDAIAAWLADPMGFETYCPTHVTYQAGGETTEHPMYRIYMSAMDLARLGSLMLEGGRWRGEAVVSEAWVEESTRRVSDVRALVPDSPYASYGYLWWIDDEGDVWAEGSGGQYIHVDRAERLVTVTRNNTGSSIPGRLWYAAAQTEDGIAEAARDAHAEVAACLEGAR